MHPIFMALHGQTTGESPQNPIVTFLPFIAIAVVFYFIFFRPQAKQQKQHQAFLAALKKGDEVVTQGGIIGQVHEVKDRYVVVDVGGGTKIRMLKGNVAGAWQENPPAKAEGKK